MTSGGWGILIAAAFLLGNSVGWWFGYKAGRADAENMVDEAVEIIEGAIEHIEADGKSKREAGVE